MLVDGNREHTVRFSLNGDSSDEAELLSRALQGAAGNRRGTDFLRFVVMRGWMEIIHGLSPKERIITLRSLGMSQSLIDEIEMRWPKPLLYQATDQSTLELQRSGANAAVAIAQQAQNFSAGGHHRAPAAVNGVRAATRIINSLGEDASGKAVPVMTAPAAEQPMAKTPAAPAVPAAAATVVAQAGVDEPDSPGGGLKKVAIAPGARRSRLNADSAMF